MRIEITEHAVERFRERVAGCGESLAECRGFLEAGVMDFDRVVRRGDREGRVEICYRAGAYRYRLVCVSSGPRYWRAVTVVRG